MTHRFNKCLLPLALTTLAAPFASHAAPSLYGFIYETVEVIESTGATSVANGGSGVNFDPTSRLSSHSSMFGIKGEESLGNGLSAFFQIESSMTPSTGSGNIAGRNTGVGLKSEDWGTVVLGHWDTPMKLSSVRADPWRTNTVAGYNSIINSPGFNVGKQKLGTGSPESTSAAFDMRATNTIQYWSPKVANFSARVMVTTSNKLNTPGTTKNQFNPYLWGFSLTYDNGPFWASYAYEHHKDHFGANNIAQSAQASFSAAPFVAGTDATGSSDQAHRLSMGYTFGGTTLGLVYERLRYRTEGSTMHMALQGYERDAVYASVEHIFSGAHHLRLAYGQTTRISCSVIGANCASGDMGARMFTVGYAYDLSKRTQLVAQFSQINNKSQSAYTFADNTPAASGAGATLRGISVGLSHRF